MVEWIFSPVVRKFPGIKVALAEGGIGWMPFFLDRCTQVVETHRYWIEKGDVRHDSLSGHVQVIEDGGFEMEGFSVMDTFRKHIYGCFIDDLHGHKEPRRDRSRQRHDRDRLSPQRLDLAELPRTRPEAARRALSDVDRHKIMRGNAERLFRFTPAAPVRPSRDGPGSTGIDRVASTNGVPVQEGMNG